MGRGLDGTELGTGIGQRKRDGGYEFRRTIDGERISFYSFDLDEVYRFIDTLDKCIETNKDIHLICNDFKKKENIVPLNAKLEKTKSKNKQKGYVYFVSNGKYCKIGRAVDIDKRIESLRSGSSQPLQLITYLESIDYINLETQLHKLFAKYKIYGEWYDILFLFDGENEGLSNINSNYVNFNNKGLLTIPELMEYTGLSENKIIELICSPHTDFTIKSEDELLVHKKLFDEFITKCAQERIAL